MEKSSSGAPKEFQGVANAYKKGQSHEETMNHYSKWVETYEADLVAVGYQAPALGAQYVAKQKLPKDAFIFDVACGTGWVAKLLKEKYGYSRFDGLDASEDMCKEARDLGIYENVYCQKIGGGNTVKVPDNHYDAAVMAGGMAEGHVPLDCFEELIRVVKPGGFIVNVTREENRRVLEAYLNTDQYFSDLAHKGCWTEVEVVITPKYYLEYDGITHVYKVTKTAQH